MKLCQTEEMLYRVGQPCLSRQEKMIRKWDNSLLCWAFISVLAFLYGCFFENMFFFFDMLCSGYFMGLVGLVRFRFEKTDRRVFLNKKTELGRQILGDNLSVKEKEEIKEKEIKEIEKNDSFVIYAGWLVLLFLGLFLLLFLFQKQRLGLYTIELKGSLVAGAVMLLLIKEGAYQLGYRWHQILPQGILWGYRYSQLPTICILLACLLVYFGQSMVLPYMLIVSYLFVMLLLCPLFKRRTLP